MSRTAPVSEPGERSEPPCFRGGQPPVQGFHYQQKGSPLRVKKNKPGRARVCLTHDSIVPYPLDVAPPR